MKYARFFSVLVFMLTALYGMVGFYYLPLAGYQGDLTRIGMLPESLFGWTRTQPVIAPALMQQASWQDADVLVIGDSFSDSHVWQTVLTGHGLRVRTEPWANIRNICEDFSPWLRAQGFRGKYVVIEAIERNIQVDFAKSVPCRKMATHYDADADTPRFPPLSVFDHDQKNYSGRLSVGIKTRINMFRYEQLAAQADFKDWTDDNVRVARVLQGCDLFSHLSCSDALFLRKDSDQDLGEDAIKSMEILNARLEGVSPIWVIVPNKSTAYLYPNKHFWDKLEQRLRSVNLLRTVRQAIQRKTVDIYPGNNTHFSTTGYLLMGQEIYQNIQSRQTANANAGSPSPAKSDSVGVRR